MNEPNEIVHHLQRMLRSEGEAIGPLVERFHHPGSGPGHCRPESRPAGSPHQLRPPRRDRLRLLDGADSWMYAAGWVGIALTVLPGYAALELEGSEWALCSHWDAPTPTADPARSVGRTGQKDRHPARRKSSAATRHTDRRRPPTSGRIIPWLL